MTSQSDITITFPSEPGYLAVARSTVESAARAMGLSAHEAGQATMAVDEALANIMRHGYQGRTDGLIRMRLTPVAKPDGCGIQVVIVDECPSIDLGRICGRPLHELRPGGLGLHIMHALMDEVCFAHCGEGQGVVLTMLKLHQPQGQQPPGPVNLPALTPPASPTPRTPQER